MIQAADHKASFCLVLFREQISSTPLDKNNNNNKKNNANACCSKEKKGEVDERSSKDEGVRTKKRFFWVITAILRMWLVRRGGRGGASELLSDRTCFHNVY